MQTRAAWVLSVQPNAAAQDLSLLQVGLANPLDLLLMGEDTVSNSVFSDGQDEVNAAPHSLILERNARLSQCQLWDIQAHYYANQGIQAWDNSVPNFITSSVYIAETYAEMILAFLTDYYDRLDLNEPVYIIELATGTGRFSFHLLRELERKLACFARFKTLKLRYIMTDFTDSNAVFWESHSRLIPFVEKGMLDFGVFNPLEDEAFDLRVSGERLDCEQVKNPVIAIANYFFDSIPMDVFRVENNTLQEGLITLERNLDGIDPASYPHISQITPHVSYQDVSHQNYYPDRRMNEVLNDYRQLFSSGSVIFPVGAFEVIRRLQTLSNGQLVLLSSDKAYVGFDHMSRHQELYEFAVHDGAFSYMMNYHAVGQYFQNAGGQFFRSTARNFSIQTVCCVSLNQAAQPAERLPYEQLHYVFAEKINRINPPNSLCAIMPGKELNEEPSARLNYMLAQLRLQMADPYLFPTIAPRLIEVVSYAWRAQHEELLHLLADAQDNYYHGPGECNLPVWVAQVYTAMGRVDLSFDCLYAAIHQFGEHELYYCLLGKNHELLEEWTQAQECYQNALRLYADFTEAQTHLELVEAKLKEA